MKKIKQDKQRIAVVTIAMFILVVTIFATAKINKRFENQISLPNKSVSFDSEKTLYCHFSIDDSNSIFEDLTVNENDYNSIFEQPILAFLESLHTKYNIVVSFYVFYSWDTTKNGFDLSKATGKYKEEFENNSDWLRFGFHAKDALAYESLDPETELEYYNKSVSELERIVGKESIDYFLRLDRYYADKETVKALKNSGVEGLLIASGTNRESYALTQEERIQCKEKDWYVDDLQMDYTPTDIQIEKIENDSHFYNTVQDFSTQQRIEIFTHEWAFNETNVKKYLTWYAYTMKQNNVKFSFSY